MYKSPVVYLVPLYTQHILAITVSEIQSHPKFTNRVNTDFCVKQALGELSNTPFHSNSMYPIVLEERYNGSSLPNKLEPMSHQSLSNFGQCCQASQVILNEGEEIQHQRVGPQIRQKVSGMLLVFLHTTTGSKPRASKENCPSITSHGFHHCLPFSLSFQDL